MDPPASNDDGAVVPSSPSNDNGMVVPPSSAGTNRTPTDTAQAASHPRSYSSDAEYYAFMTIVGSILACVLALFVWLLDGVFKVDKTANAVLTAILFLLFSVLVFWLIRRYQKQTNKGIKRKIPVPQENNSIRAPDLSLDILRGISSGVTQVKLLAGTKAGKEGDESNISRQGSDSYPGPAGETVDVKAFASTEVTDVRRSTRAEVRIRSERYTPPAISSSGSTGDVPATGSNGSTGAVPGTSSSGSTGAVPAIDARPDANRDEDNEPPQNGSINGNVYPDTAQEESSKETQEESSKETQEESSKKTAGVKTSIKTRTPIPGKKPKITDPGPSHRKD